MTPRVPLVCTPEDLYRAMADVAKVVNGPPIFGGPALIPESVLALFRPAEERKEAERNTGFDSRSGATLPSSSGAGMANPVAGGRAPGQDALSSAPVAPPPAGEPAWMTPELRKNLDCMVFVDAQVFSQARASMVAAIDHAVLSALAALRAENERLRQQLDPPTQSGSFGATTAKVAGNCTKCNGYIYHDPHHIGEYLHECVPPGENRSEG